MLLFALASPLAAVSPSATVWGDRATILQDMSGASPSICAVALEWAASTPRKPVVAVSRSVAAVTTVYPRDRGEASSLGSPRTLTGAASTSSPAVTEPVEAGSAQRHAALQRYAADSVADCAFLSERLEAFVASVGTAAANLGEAVVPPGSISLHVAADVTRILLVGKAKSGVPDAALIASLSDAPPVSPVTNTLPTSSFVSALLARLSDGWAAPVTERDGPSSTSTSAIGAIGADGGSSSRAQPAAASSSSLSLTTCGGSGSGSNGEGWSVVSARRATVLPRAGLMQPAFAHSFHEGTTSGITSGSTGGGGVEGRRTAHSLPDIHIQDCHDCNVFNPHGSKLASVVGCSRSCIVLGPCASHVLIDGCEGCHIVVAGRAVTLRNCCDTTVSFWSSSRPILSGDNRGLKLGPYSGQLPALMHEAAALGLFAHVEPASHSSGSGSSGKVGDDGIWEWIPATAPIVSASGATASASASAGVECKLDSEPSPEAIPIDVNCVNQWFHPYVVAQAEALPQLTGLTIEEGSEDACKDTPSSPTGSPLKIPHTYASHVTRLEPADFTCVKCPCGETALSPPAPSGPLSLLPLPVEYGCTLQRRRGACEGLRRVLEGAKLAPTDYAALQLAVQAAYADWLVDTGAAHRIAEKTRVVVTI